MSPTRSFTRSRGLRSSVRRPLRSVEWKRGLFSGMTVDPVTTTVGQAILVPQAVLADYTGATITRVLLQIQLIAEGADGTFVQGALGVTLVNGFELSVCTIQEGNSNRWMAWMPFQLLGATTPVDGVSYRNLALDVRSQRKATDGQELHFAIELIASSTAGVSINAGFSVLVKE